MLEEYQHVDFVQQSVEDPAVEHMHARRARFDRLDRMGGLAQARVGDAVRLAFQNLLERVDRDLVERLRKALEPAFILVR